jgi:hypothetical protein
VAITHQYQGPLRRIQLVILATFVVALVAIGVAWHHPSHPSTTEEVTKIVTTYVGHAGYARDLYTVKVTTSLRWPAWALFWELATKKGEATFQNTYGIAEEVKGQWKMVEWGTALVGCRQSPQTSPIPALAMKDLGMPCPKGWN